MIIKRTLVGIAAGALILGSLAIPAFASGGYGSQPGYSTAITNSGGCAGAGSFGAFGQGFNWGNSTSGHTPYPGNAVNGNGADGSGTGYNNSNLCGNPQGNP